MWPCFKCKRQRYENTEAFTDNTTLYNMQKQVALQPKWRTKTTCLCPGFRAFSRMGKFDGRICKLPEDLLINEIILRVAKQDEGPRTLCRLSCVCKHFNVAVNRPEILKEVKVSWIDSYLLHNSKKTYQNFVWKCATMGNPRAMAAVVVSYGYCIGERDDSFVLTERLHAAYLLGMTLFESESTRRESFHLIMRTAPWGESEHIEKLRKKARHYLSRLGINRPLNLVCIDCDDEYCGWKIYQQGRRPLEKLSRYLYWCSDMCQCSYLYENFRVASLR